MKLVRARVTHYRSIDDSGWVDFDDITCLVGKNESGKTAFLQALARLNPVEGEPDKYDPVLDYPSKDYGKYRKRHEDDPDTVAVAKFELDDEEVEIIEKNFGAGVLTSGRQVSLTKNYKNRSTWVFDSDQGVVTQHLLETAELAPPGGG